MNDQNFTCADCGNDLTHRKELINYVCFDCQEIEDEKIKNTKEEE